MDILKHIVKRVLQYEARLIVRRYKPRIIAFVGSVGKTTTRDMLYHILAKRFFVRRNGTSLTSAVGIPLAIMGSEHEVDSLFGWFRHMFVGLKHIMSTKPYPEYLLLEIDGDKPGDIELVTNLFIPDMLVLTEIGDVPAHVETFGTLEAFLDEYRKIVGVMNKDGVVLYNSTDPYVKDIAEAEHVKTIACGIEGGVVTAGEPKVLYGQRDGVQVPTGMSFTLSLAGYNEQVTLFDTVGTHYGYALALSAAAAHELGLSVSFIVERLSSYKVLPGRMRLVSGLKGSTIVDDSYNSSPVAARESLQLFGTLSADGRKIVVFGDMLELGRYSTTAHKELAPLVASGNQLFLSVGIRSRSIADEVLSYGMHEYNVFSYDTAEEAGRDLQTMLASGDVVFVKGSQNMRMEKVVEEVMAHPRDKKTLLVRQEKRWQEKE